MRIAAVMLLIGLVGLWPAWSDPGAEKPRNVKNRTLNQEKVTDYAESAGKRNKYRLCVRIGEGECRAKYRQALEWCLKNPDECVLLIKGAGVSPRQYADQEAAKCRNELDRKCRAQAGF